MIGHPHMDQPMHAVMA